MSTIVSLVHIVSLVRATGAVAAHAGAAAAAPTPVPIVPVPGLEATAGTFLGWIKWIGMLAGIGGLMACGIMMAIGRRNRSALSADGASGIPWVLGGLSLLAMAPMIVSVLVQ
jgi:hypothetical protein